MRPRLSTTIRTLSRLEVSASSKFASFEVDLPCEARPIEAAAWSADRLGQVSIIGGSWDLWVERICDPWNANRSVALSVPVRHDQKFDWKWKHTLICRFLLACYPVGEAVSEENGQILSSRSWGIIIETWKRKPTIKSFLLNISGILELVGSLFSSRNHHTPVTWTSESADPGEALSGKEYVIRPSCKEWREMAGGSRMTAMLCPDVPSAYSPLIRINDTYHQDSMLSQWLEIHHLRYLHQLPIFSSLEQNSKDSSCRYLPYEKKQ